MIKNKCKKTVSTMLLMTMIVTTCNTNVFAGGEFSCVKVDIHCESVFKDCCSESYDSLNNEGQKSNSTYTNKSNTATVENGHIIVGKEIENKKIKDIVSIPEDKIKSVTFKNGVTSIGFKAFDGCKNLKEVNIPYSVIFIGNSSFYGCKNLKEVTIPYSITSIGSCAFSGCTSLKEITIPNNITSIGQFAFEGCKGLKSITIPNITKIDEWTFANCTGLTSVIIPNSVTEISQGAFKGCKSLTSITIGNGVKYLDKGAFYGCSGLKEVTIPKELDITGIFNEHVKINRI